MNPRRAILPGALLVKLLACAAPPSASVSVALVVTVDAAPTLRAPEPAPAPEPPPAPPPAPTAPPAPPAPPAPAALEQVVAAAGNQLFALRSGVLQRRAERWLAVPTEGVSLRALAVDRGVLYALGVGAGSNAGRLVLLRLAPRTHALELDATAPLEPGGDPRALLVERDGSYYVGGSHPALLHLTRTNSQPVSLARDTVTALFRGRDDAIVAQHGAQDLSVLRYGVASLMERDDVYTVVTSPADGQTCLVHTDGQFVHGRPGREYLTLTDRTPSPPLYVALLPPEDALVFTTTHQLFRWRNRRWTELTTLPFTDAVALLGTSPPLLVSAQGEVVSVGLSGVAAWPSP